MTRDDLHDLGCDRPNNKTKAEDVIAVLEMLKGCKTYDGCTANCEICVYGQYSNTDLVKSLEFVISELRKQV